MKKLFGCLGLVVLLPILLLSIAAIVGLIRDGIRDWSKTPAERAALEKRLQAIEEERVAANKRQISRTHSTPPAADFDRLSAQSDKWYVGGTLHEATGKEWVTASRRNRIATAADMIAKTTKLRVRSMDQLLSPTIELESCMSTALQDTTPTKDGIIGHWSVKDIGVMCILTLNQNQ